MFNIILRPLYALKRDPIPFEQEAGSVPVAAWWVPNISHPRGFDPLTIQLVATQYTDYVLV
jgi:hypothetical protein